MSTYYLFRSRILTHITFWLIYFTAFGLIWAKQGDYHASYYLEFILLPIRISAVYLMLYFVIPSSLLVKKYGKFIYQYAILLLLSGLMQRLFIYFFYESNGTFELWQVFNLGEILRAIILINSTVIFVSFFKILTLYHNESDRKKKNNQIELKSEHKVFRVEIDDILFIKGMGNYVVYHFKSEKTIIAYSSMKEALLLLPDHFQRIHKSYIINSEKIDSYSSESLDVAGKEIPIGKSYELK